MKFRFLVLALTIASGSNAWADTQPFYQSIVGAIQRANAQADVTLMKGIWRTVLGDSTAIWNIPTVVRATLITTVRRGRTLPRIWGPSVLDIAILVCWSRPQKLCQLGGKIRRSSP
jgi:hypothetical protein